MFYSKNDLNQYLKLNLNTLNKYLSSIKPTKNQVKKINKTRLYSKDYLISIFKKNNRQDLIDLLNNLKDLKGKEYKDTNTSQNGSKNQLYDVLQNQVKDLQNQIEIKDNQIENLTRLLENQQTLLKNQQTLELTDKNKTKSNPVNKFLGWFKK